MKSLHNRVNIVPVIAKADTLTRKEISRLKKRILDEIAKHNIKIYQLPDVEEDEEEDYKEQTRVLKVGCPIIFQKWILWFLGINSFCSGRINSANRSQRQKSSWSTLSMGCSWARKWWTLRLFEITNNAHVSTFEPGRLIHVRTFGLPYSVLVRCVVLPRRSYPVLKSVLHAEIFYSDHICKIFKKSLTIYITKIIELLVSQMVPIPTAQVILSPKFLL